MALKFFLLDKNILKIYKVFLVQYLNINQSKKKKYFSSFKAFMVYFDAILYKENIKNIPISIFKKKSLTSFFEFMIFKKKIYNNKNFLYYILNLFPFPKNIYGPGCFYKNFFQKYFNIINFRRLEFKLSQINFQNCHENKLKFLMLLNQKSIHINKFFFYIIPDFFFSDEIHNYDKSFCKTTVFSSSMILFEQEFSRYFSLKFPFKFSLVQHGGAFGEWKNHLYEKIEENIVDQKVKLNPTFLIKKKIYFKQNKIKRLIFAFRTKTRKFQIITSTHLYNHNNTKTLINKKILEDYNFFLKLNPKGLHQVYKNIYPSNLPTTKNIQNGDLIVFDSLSSTLVYNCIVNKIPFVYILPELNYKKITKNFLHFLNLMKINNLLIIPKSQNDVRNFLDNIKNINYYNTYKINSKILKILKYN